MLQESWGRGDTLWILGDKVSLDTGMEMGGIQMG